MKKAGSASMKKSAVDSAAKIHPSRRLVSTKGITQGQPLKNLLRPFTVDLIAESFVDAYPKFDVKKFAAQSKKGLEAMELVARAKHIGQALVDHLPKPFSKALPIFVDALGPVEQQDDSGISVFFFYPHSMYLSQIATLPDSKPDDVLKANLELTKRFTAEFSIRAMIERDEKLVLKVMREKWSCDPHAAVRRLVSEGTRTRLPWGSHLPRFKADPSPCFPLLEALKWDPELYVRRSVANHVGDILKDNAAVGYKLLEGWVASANSVDAVKAEVRRRQAIPWAAASVTLKDGLTESLLHHQLREQLCWVVRHAVRCPAKKGEKRAVQLRKLAEIKPIPPTGSAVATTTKRARKRGREDDE